MTYQGFPYQAAELSAFGVTCGIFVISLKDGGITHFTPEDGDRFHDWLLSLHVREVVANC